MKRFPYHRRAEMAQIILAAVEERVERGRSGDRMAGLLGAADSVGDVLADALEDALHVTAGEVLEQAGPEAVRSYANAAETTYSGAGTQILVKAADWADPSEDPVSIIGLGAETPEIAAADSGFHRWLGRCRPGLEPHLSGDPLALATALEKIEVVAAVRPMTLPAGAGGHRRILHRQPGDESAPHAPADGPHGSSGSSRSPANSRWPTSEPSRSPASTSPDASMSSRIFLPNYPAVSRM